ncbi:hypothetical protein ACFWXK_13165 [Streptomyces sp. NPDC059070]|uniref:hypothetical protein n=1 Tax=unclassified Streptomyces TaxID=2593676 RepID=UPI0034E22D3B
MERIIRGSGSERPWPRRAVTVLLGCAVTAGPVLLGLPSAAASVTPSPAAPQLVTGADASPSASATEAAPEPSKSASASASAPASASVSASPSAASETPSAASAAPVHPETAAPAPSEPAASTSAAEPTASTPAAEATASTGPATTSSAAPGTPVPDPPGTAAPAHRPGRTPVRPEHSFAVPSTEAPAGRGAGGSSPAAGARRPVGQADLVASAEAIGRGEPGGRAGGAVRGPDGVYDYLITAVNHGPSQATDVTVTDELPESLVFVSSRDGCTARGRTITCGPLPKLGVGESHAWSVTVRLADDYDGDGSDITNSASVTSPTHDPRPENNTASVTGLPVSPDWGRADLALTKTAVLAEGRRWVRPGETFRYRITVRNQGPGVARQVRVSDPLPGELSFVASSDDCAPDEANARTVLCPSLDRLAPGASVSYEITVRVAKSLPRHLRQIDNIASVTSATRDPDESNNQNASHTTGPDGGPLYVKPWQEPDGELPDTGSDVPDWLGWLAGTAVAAGAVLVTAARRRTSGEPRR